jgi:hypothetical protein
MGIFTDHIGVLKSKLTSSEARPLFGERDMLTEQKRISRARKLYDYYIFNRENILSYVTGAMGNTFKAKTISAMQFPLYNLTKKIINQLAVAYLLPAERYVVVKKAGTIEAGNKLVIEDTRAAKDNEIYHKILIDSNINAAAKLWNRLAKLVDTVYVGVMFRDGKIEYDVLPPHGIEVEADPNNYLEPKVVSYERAVGNQNYKFIWTDDKYVVLDKNDKMVKGEVNEWNGVNRYGVIPLIPCRLSIPDDHWGEGDTELVFLNEKLNILSASMFHNVLLQSHGVAFGVNLHLGDTKPEDGAESPQVQTGPGWMIEANDVRKEDVLPTLEFLHPDPAIESNIKTAEWLIKTAAILKGLSAQNVSIEPNDNSGVAKTIDLAELRERRQDDVEFLRPFEKRLFDLTRIVWNTHNTEKISDKAVFGIDFVEPKNIISEKESLEVRQLKIDAGILSPLDGIIDEDEGIDEEQAMAYLMRNLEHKKMIDEMRTPNQLSLLVNEPDEPADIA